MVGMNSVIMDEVIIGDNSIIGALTFIKAGGNIPPRSLVVGNPGKVVKEVTDEMINWKTKGTNCTRLCRVNAWKASKLANLLQQLKSTALRRKACTKRGMPLKTVDYLSSSEDLTYIGFGQLFLNSTTLGIFITGKIFPGKFKDLFFC